MVAAAAAGGAVSENVTWLLDSVARLACRLIYEGLFVFKIIFHSTISGPESLAHSLITLWKVDHAEFGQETRWF